MDIYKKALLELQKVHSGEIYFDELTRAIYATDASVYRTLPLAVAYPKNTNDIKQLIVFAQNNNTSLIPRTAGTSLAGQCVGEGIIVDVSKYFTKILDVNEQKKTVTVQPGVVRDELNNYLKPFGLFFGPNTSTSNRCMIGGMVGNNSSGTTSIQYGVTRDKVLALKTILSDGSDVLFTHITSEKFEDKINEDSLEGHIYKTIYKELKDPLVQEEIRAQFPKPEIHRRNTGYAIDALIASEVFGASSQFNMCKLLSGSEGTLAFTTEITLQLDLLPPEESIICAAHFSSIEDCLNAVELVMAHNLYTCEMIDKTILDCTKQNKQQLANRQFIVGDPKAILMCEVRAKSIQEVQTLASDLKNDIEHSGLSYAFPLLQGEEIAKSMALRNAGLGLLGNMIGDKKTAACIEDTAVALKDLSIYIREFTLLMSKHNQEAVYYAHAGAGELHLRPVLNLKKSEDVALFRKLTTETAQLVKKYQGSMSGEHGDGIVRAEFIPMMIGEKNYAILNRIKVAFDPNNIFNPGKIVNALPMDASLRYVPDRIEPEIDTILDFSSSLGILREAEKCNGSGDCRKLPEFGGTMCPSYRATRNEKDTTRARANALREFLTNSEKANKFDHKELKDVFDLCLSCKACSSECPSSVDVASLKAEFQYQYQEANGYSFKNRFFANATKYNRLASKSPKLFNYLFSNTFSSGIVKRVLGIDGNRSFPKVSKPFNQVFEARNDQLDKPIKTVYLFIDEFTNYLESYIAVDANVLLKSLNYKVINISRIESGRSFISKGFLKESKALANSNISYFSDKINDTTPLIGIEPSAILSFKDEYLRLTDNKELAQQIAANTYLVEEFIAQEVQLGNITASQFTKDAMDVKFHGHCQQKALSTQDSSYSILSLPDNYTVSIIPSGCCGMAGSFGYECAHYNISMAIGEQTLFPHVRNSHANTIIAANGTSCRHQIKDGTERVAQHPVSILKEALV